MNLIPGVSTYLRLLNDIPGFTLSKIYPIVEWSEEEDSGTVYAIIDDLGTTRYWIYYENDPEVEDVSFEANLKSILE